MVGEITKSGFMYIQRRTIDKQMLKKKQYVTISINYDETLKTGSWDYLGSFEAIVCPIL